MIREATGDLLLSRAAAIAHGVAPNDDFHQGLALALRERFPAMYKDFRHECHIHHPKEGTVWAWGGAEHVRVIALFTQEGAYGQGAKPGRARLEHVRHALHELAKLTIEERWPSLAVPRLATGVGGLEWADVKPLVEDILGSLPIPVIVYSTYRAGVKADEGLADNQAREGT
jgi:O-acetyl-ADP-ribose deacetylase (regulator of RNase III)